MKPHNKFLLIAFGILLGGALTAQAALPILKVIQGGTGAATFGQGWLHSAGGTSALTSSTSPTVNYLTATSTTATSTFAGGLSIGTTGNAPGLAVLSNATSTFAQGINLGAGCFAVNGTCITGGSSGGSSLWATSTADTLAISPAGALRIGIGTTTPAWGLQVASTTGPQFALTDQNAGTNLKHWTMRSVGGNLYIATSSDAFATSTSAFVTLNTNNQIILGNTDGSATLPTIGLNDTNTGLFMLGADNLAITTNGTRRMDIDAGSMDMAVSVRGSSGTVGSPSYAFTVDTNTGIYSPLNTSTGGLGFVIDGVDAMRMLPGIFTGIGTTTPKYLLQLASSTAPQLALSDGSLTSNHWTMRNAGGLLYFATSSPSTFATSTTAALTIDTNGNLGVGTTSPWRTFSVNGNAYVTETLGIGTVATANAFSVLSPSVASTREAPIKVAISDAPADAFFVSNSTSANGNFVPQFTGFLDTRSDRPPLIFLGLVTAANDTGTTAMMRFNTQLTTSTSDPINNLSSAITTRPLFEWTNADVAQMSILANGKVGVATTSPTATLGVHGTMMAILTTFASGDSAVCQRGVGGFFTVNTGVTSCLVSSQFVKHNISPFSTQEALGRLMKLDPKMYSYNSTNKADIGLIAEEVAKVDPRYAEYTSAEKVMDGHTFKAGDPTAIHWGAITADLVKVVQEQQKQIEKVAVEKTRSIEENWQDLFIGFLFLAFLWQQRQIYKLKNKII